MQRRFVLLGLPALALMGGGWREQSGDELSGERSFQMTLPRSKDPLWPKLGASKVTYNTKTALYDLTPTPEVRAMAGKTIRVHGFIIPLDGLDMTKHFLIGINTPVCLFHPPGEPNEVIEVRSVRPVRWTDDPVTVEGVFGLIRNTEMGVFFTLSQAKPVK